MTLLEQTAELYASVLRQLLPVGGYDASPNTEALAVDVYAHAKLFAQADLDAKRLLNVLEGFPSELISEYEAEYGLPLKCSINAGRTLAERIEILRWIRQHRNVMNRQYLEQILAIFGVTLVDVVKHYPMQCTAPCTSPVNTERLRYKVLLRLQYPMTADMSCIIENYLPGYLRVEWVVDMPWGEWILNSDYELSGDNIRYTAYKTNQRDFYDSLANFDLITALVRSFHDTDMQQWQGFKDAANALIGREGWLVDISKSMISSSSRTYELRQSPPLVSDSIQSVCKLFANQVQAGLGGGADFYFLKAYGAFSSGSSYDFYCTIWRDRYGNQTFYRTENGYEGDIVTIEKPFTELAFKIITNAKSDNQGIALFAEAYLENIAQSIFNQDEAKQFVKLSELLSQFELNKKLRT